jgi:PAS domain S-box-containing protein
MVNHPVSLPAGMPSRFFVRTHRLAVTSVPGQRVSKAGLGLRSFQCVLLSLGIVTAVFLVSSDRASAADSGERKRILVINSFSPDTKGVSDYERDLDSVVVAGVPNSIEIDREYLDFGRFYDKGYERQWHYLLAHKYKHKRLDLIILAFLPAAKFGLKYNRLFPRTPMIICPVDEREIRDISPGPNVMVCTDRYNIKDTVETALRLQPDTRRVVVVSGTSPFESLWEKQMKIELRELETKVQFEYVSDQPMNEILRELQSPPEHTVVFYFSMFRDGAGQTFLPQEALSLLHKSSAVPIYGSFLPSFPGSGIIGGSLERRELEGKQAGEMALRILRGDKAPEVAVSHLNTSAYVFDWRELNRLNINEARLPPGSVVVFRQPSFWTFYKRYIIVGSALCLVETLLVIALWFQRRHLRRARKLLLEQLGFQKLVASLSTQFVKQPPTETDGGIEQALGEISSFFQLDRCGLLEVETAKKRVHVSHALYNKGVRQVSRDINLADLFPWSYESIVGQGKPYLAVERLADLPSGAEKDRQSWAAAGVKSTLIVPLFADNRVHHAIVMQAMREGQTWPEQWIAQLRLLGEIFVNALERKQADHDLRESESRFRHVADSAPVMVWMSGTDRLCTYFNKPWLDFTGRSLEQEIGIGWAEGVHSDDLDRCLAIYSEAFDARREFNMEYRLRRFDGQYRWVFDRGVPRYESDGAFLGFIGSCLDITDRKAMEETLLDLGGRLIATQEEERSRIARELHDDLSQNMALILIALEELQSNIPDLSATAKGQLDDIARKVSDVSSDIHDLSHQLHPAKLDTLGLVAALASYCREFSKQHHLQIQFVEHDVPRSLPKNITLCIYRIVQEALWNVVKHSGTREVELKLTGSPATIDLCVSDSGAGFDPELAQAKGGLGLISMRERLQLVGGELQIESQPSRGTRINAWVPISQDLHEGVTDSKTRKANA